MSTLELAEAQTHRSLTVFPVVSPEQPELSCTLLGEALAAGVLEVTEVGEGRVPELAVENKGDSDVLILDGEQLIGARQNRMTNRTILLGGRTKTVIPVSCMEHGRWDRGTAAFRHHDHYSPSRVRRHARRSEYAAAEAMESPGPQVLAGAQGAVWGEIAKYSFDVGESSDTGALDHLYRARSADLNEWSQHFPWVDDQIGILAFLGGRPLGMDVIGGHRLYAKLHKRLVTGYVMDALAARDGGEVEVTREATERFLAAVDRAKRTRAPTVGEGVYEVLSGEVMGAELRHDSIRVHLSAFPLEAARGERDASAADDPVAPPSRRRRWRDG